MICKPFSSPPSIKFVQNHYQEYSEDIQIILNFMLSFDYEDIYILDNGGTLLADLTEVAIDDKEVSNAIDRLFTSRAYYHIIKNGDTIYLLQWKGLRDVGCGIAYSINENDTPEIEYVTQLVPFSDDGWFYYVSDYAEWHNTK
jgi:hypothetical protein